MRHFRVMPLLICAAVILAFSACSKMQKMLPALPPYTLGHGVSEENQVNPSQKIPPEAVTFTNLTVENGLSQSTIGCIFQDNRGFLWFCTYEGVDRFDGYKFINFNHDPQNFNSLRDNIVYSITEDKSGNLWIGTLTGLDLYDPQNDSFTHISLDVAGKAGAGEVPITSLLTDQAGMVWVGSHQGVFSIVTGQDRSLEIKHYPLVDIKGEIVEKNPVGALYQDADGVIWAGTRYGLSYYDPAENRFIWVMTYSLDNSSVVTQTITELEPGVLLLGGGYGLISYDVKTNKAVLMADKKQFMSTEFGVVWSLARSEDGVIWIGTDFGLFQMDPRSGESKILPQIQENPDEPETIVTVFKDQEGNLWVGTLNQGLFVHRPWMHKFPAPETYIEESVQQGKVAALYKDRQGALWVSLDQELLRIDTNHQEIHHYRYLPGYDRGHLDNNVSVITEDTSGNLWVGTLTGSIYFYDPAHDSFTRMFGEAIYPGTPNVIFVDGGGDVWVGTENGLNRYQGDQGIWESFLLDPNNTARLSGNTVNTIQQDETGDLWFGTWDGLFVFNQDTSQFSKVDFSTAGIVASIDTNILAILPDHAGGLWLGAQNGGLYHFDMSTRSLTSYLDTGDVTPGAIFAILEDNQENLWLSTQRGLSKFDPKRVLFTHYTHEDGLPSNEFIQGAYFQAGDGEMFFGNIDGLVAFYPEEVPQNSHRPAIVLSMLTQNGERMNMNTPFDSLEAFTLSWPNNYFEFEFAALSFAQPDDNQYAYYLDGIDPDWMYAGKNRCGRYVNLPGGSYTLHLIGSNNDGVWNTEGTVITVTVIPPIWQRTWFQVTVLLCLIALTFAGFRYRVRHLEFRSKELERLVDERTKELSQINTQLVQEITEREKTERSLVQRMAAEAVLSERNRLARDLHDSVTQTIFSASILSETLPHSLEAYPDKARGQIEELQQLTRGALAELRSLLFELRPEGLVKTDLKDLLGQLCKGTTGRSGIPVEFDCFITAEVPSEVKITLYRIAQEALNNASRHADPSRIKVYCSSDQEIIHMTVRDDGKGFNYSEKLNSRMGLGIMQERAGDIGASLGVESFPGSGTTIKVEWLFPRNGDSDE